MGQNGQPKQAENPATVERKSEREIVVTRTFDHPAQAVFEAWTLPELFKLWWAPKSICAVLSACEIDARTGGSYRMTFGGNGSDTAIFFGKYLEVTPPSRLVWTNDESDDGPITTVSFEDQGERTLLALSELYRSAESVPETAGTQAMMSEQFAQLDELLASTRSPT